MLIFVRKVNKESNVQEASRLAAIIERQKKITGLFNYVEWRIYNNIGTGRNSHCKLQPSSLIPGDFPCCFAPFGLLLVVFVIQCSKLTIYIFSRVSNRSALLDGSAKKSTTKISYQAVQHQWHTLITEMCLLLHSRIGRLFAGNISRL